MDNFIVSARKYRPSTFRQVVGQTNITSTLQNAIKNKHLAQAFLFTGPRGVGKTTCARILAKTINCENPTEDMEPCNECESCISFNNNASFNIHELDAASNNTVDDIRRLVEQVRIPPQTGEYKVYIIDEVHMLSSAAFNAFLKTLEEPPSYAKFILATTERHKIIPTILSRCQIFDFKRISIEDIADYLDHVSKSEKIEAEIEALTIIAQKADGAMRDALSTFDQIVSYSGSKITYKNVIDNLNILDYEYYFRVTGYLLRNEISLLIDIYNEIVENGFDGQHFLMGLANHLRSLLILKAPETEKLLHSSGSLKEKYITQSKQAAADFILQALRVCNKYELSYKSSNNKNLHVEIALLEIGELSGVKHNITDAAYIPISNPSEKPLEYKTEPQKSEIPKVEKPVTSKTETPTIQNVKEPIISKEAEVKKTEIKENETIKDKKVEVESSIKSETEEEKKNSKEPDHSTTENVHKSKLNNGKTRVIKNISIKDGLAAIRKKKEDDEEVDEPVIDNVFTIEKLISSWKNFVSIHINKSPSFANAIAKYEPMLKDNFVIEYKVDSLLISEDIHSVTSLLEYLKNELNNNQITLQAVLPPKSDKKTAYTDREKFKELTKKYPEVQKLKDQLNMELDF